MIVTYSYIMIMLMAALKAEMHMRMIALQVQMTHLKLQMRSVRVTALEMMTYMFQRYAINRSTSNNIITS